MQAYPPRETARIVDIETSRANVINTNALFDYFQKLRSSLLLALSVGGASLVVGFLCISDLSFFVAIGKGLLHPGLTLFLGLVAFFMLIVSSVSAIIAVRYLKEILSEICRIPSDSFSESPSSR